MSTALSLILIVGAAYLAAHVLFEWLARKYRIVSGAEYLVLGILLGPQASGVIATDIVSAFAPFTTLALGWVGAAVGMNLFLPRLVQIPGHVYKLAGIEAVITLLFVSGVMVFAFAAAFGLDYRQVILPAVSLGAIATATSASGVVFASTKTPGPVLQQLEITTFIDAVVSITAFGVLLSIVHIDVSIGTRPLTATEWLGISIAIGIVGGVLFHLFLGPERNPDRLFIAMSGAIILASGAASFLRLSPMFSSMIIGAILVNTSTSRAELQRLMSSVEKPLYFVLLLFAGASWRPSRYDWFLPVVLYVFVRIAAKIGAARLASRASEQPELRQSNWGLGLLGQGTLALAIAMNYSLNDIHVVPNVVFTAAVASVLVTDLFGFRIVAALLESANGEGDR